ncbi:holo-ACP synthase [Bombella favorum]|uniref:Holo-[acyl-carrier-protein] synthase n=1 Tax=Bombella favorum TaxID=2039164 RepID=A0ABR5ZLM1_9PROT|nr:holo-ACP synthase [Bombella favorum]MBA5725231.1 holo-ACP synthase [Bombella favorum]
MILGIGVDLCSIERIERALSRHGDAFLERVFTQEERAYVQSLRGVARAGACAKRWAAKEACAKALGTGFAQGVQLQDISVGRDALGAPVLSLSGVAADLLEKRLPVGHKAVLLLSMSDEPPMAMAQVLIQAVAQSV